MLPTLSRCLQLRYPPFPVQDKARNRRLPHSNNKHPHSNRHLLHKVSSKLLLNKELGQSHYCFLSKKDTAFPLTVRRNAVLFVCSGMERGRCWPREQNNGGSSDRLAFILWEAPLLDNKPLRLFLKTERCHTKYATHVDLPAGCTSTFGGICDFHCVEHKAPEPSSVHVWSQMHMRWQTKRLRCGQKEKPFAQKCKGL